MVKMYTVTLMMGSNDVSRGESRKVLRLQEKMSCILEELRIYLDPAILTICKKFGKVFAITTEAKQDEEQVMEMNMEQQPTKKTHFRLRN